MELAGQGSYRRLAEEIGEVLQAAAETAEKMQEDARLEAARIRAEAETDRRDAYAEGRRILDDARMEADMVRAEAEWQAQEIVAQARRQAAERMAGADGRIAEMTQAETRVMDRLAGVSQVLAETMATLREGAANAPLPTSEPITVEIPPAEGADESEHVDAKVYFVEFPPAPDGTEAAQADPDPEIVLADNPGPSLFGSDEERSEWAPPADLPTWWTRDGAQG
jgi:hypothetical protein